MEIIPNNKLLDLSGKSAIVTGAVGIGYGIAYRLAEAGANVVVASINEQEVNDVVTKLTEKGWKAKGARVDVSAEEDVKRMVEETINDFGVSQTVNGIEVPPTFQSRMKELQMSFKPIIPAKRLCPRDSSPKLAPTVL